MKITTYIGNVVMSWCTYTFTRILWHRKIIIIVVVVVALQTATNNNHNNKAFCHLKAIERLKLIDAQRARPETGKKIIHIKLLENNNKPNMVRHTVRAVWVLLAPCRLKFLKQERTEHEMNVFNRMKCVVIVGAVVVAVVA